MVTNLRCKICYSSLEIQLLVTFCKRFFIIPVLYTIYFSRQIFKIFSEWRLIFEYDVFVLPILPYFALNFHFDFFIDIFQFYIYFRNKNFFLNFVLNETELENIIFLIMYDVNSSTVQTFINNLNS